MSIPILTIDAITISASNTYIDLQFTGGSARQTGMNNGTYDIFEAAVELEARIQSLSGLEAGYGLISVSVDYSTAPYGRIKITNGHTADLAIKWNTGPKKDTNCGTALGFDDSADDTVTAGSYIIADWSVATVWSPSKHPQDETTWTKELVGGNEQRTLSGTNTKQLVAGTRSQRQVWFEGLHPEDVWNERATGANQYRDFETFWDLAKGVTGTSAIAMRYYPDISDDSTYTDCYLIEPKSLASIKRQRYQGIELYALDLLLYRKE